MSQLLVLGFEFFQISFVRNFLNSVAIHPRNRVGKHVQFQRREIFLFLKLRENLEVKPPHELFVGPGSDSFFLALPSDVSAKKLAFLMRLPGGGVDLAGDGDHWAATVISPAFAGKSKIQQHQMVYGALGGRMGGVLHALKLTTMAQKP